MPEWFNHTFATDLEHSSLDIAARLISALALGCVVAMIYRLTHGRAGGRGGGGLSVGLMATLVLLTVLIAMVTLVIGNNVARAFSLVGALAIVRFRTIVEDTRDTAFVIFAVVVGMALGSGAWQVPILGIPIVAAGAFLFGPRATVNGGALDHGAAEWLLTVRVGNEQLAEGPLDAALGAHLRSWRLSGVISARGGSAFEKTYSVRFLPGQTAAGLAGALTGMEGVQGVELRPA
ncbi:MAG: hypothetical protein WD749_08670 [Phycisphaerales bacterium]